MQDHNSNPTDSSFTLTWIVEPSADVSLSYSTELLPGFLLPDETDLASADVPSIIDSTGANTITMSYSNISELPPDANSPSGGAAPFPD